MFKRDTAAAAERMGADSGWTVIKLCAICALCCEAATICITAWITASLGRAPRAEEVKHISAITRPFDESAVPLAMAAMAIATWRQMQAWCCAWQPPDAELAEQGQYAPLRLLSVEA